MPIVRFQGILLLLKQNSFKGSLIPMKQQTQIIVLAYPDTYVTLSDEWICRVLPMVGLGTREYIKAGHAALILVGDQGELHYFDFGRYITPKGYGRVRSAQTDAELRIPLRAIQDHSGRIENLSEVLGWLDQNPDKTHGDGRLIASVCQEVDYFKARAYIDEISKRGSIPYGAFNKSGSNCSRFVADTLLAATTSARIRRKLTRNKLFTPSTVGNVEIAATDNKMYQVQSGKIDPYLGSALRENLKNYFDKSRPVLQRKNTSAYHDLPEGAQFLGGTGSQAWFHLDTHQLAAGIYRIRRFTPWGELDYDGVYESRTFRPERSFEFTYDSHCEYCHVYQDNQKIFFQGKGSFAQFNSWQSRRVVGM